MLAHESRTSATEQTGALWRMASTRLPTQWGVFEAMGFERDVRTGGPTVETALALVLGDLHHGVPLLRVHSQCVTGETFGSLRCDCGGQLTVALQAIAQEGRGLVIYEFQEGRGIGLTAKLQAYELQDVGIDTIEANHALGFRADLRDFSLAAEILHDLRISRVRLLTNNPRKVRALSSAGIKVAERVPCEVDPTTHSFTYLQTKKHKLGHALHLETPRPRSDGAGHRSATVTRKENP